MQKFVKIISLIFIGLLIIFVTLCADVFLIEPNVLLCKSQKLEIPHWDKKLNGFKIVLVTDVHLGTKFVNLNKLQKTVKLTNAKNPDLIIICGDLDAKSITQAKYSITQVANVLKEFKAKYGVVAVMGNHDYAPPNVIKSIYQKANIPLLENQDYFINHNGKTIRLVGLKDLWHYKTAPSQVIGSNYNNVPTIVLAHNPDSFAQMPDSASLTLSGHTHGGEVVLPVVGSFVVPSKYGQRYRSGHIIESNKHLFVSKGVATFGYGRFLAQSEINVLRLYSKDEKVKDTKPISGVMTNHAPWFVNKILAIKKQL